MFRLDFEPFDSTYIIANLCLFVKYFYNKKHRHKGLQSGGYNDVIGGVPLVWGI